MDVEYEALRLVDLRQLCIARDLQRSGNKDQLIERLYRADREEARRRLRQQEPIRHQSQVSVRHFIDAWFA